MNTYADLVKLCASLNAAKYFKTPTYPCTEEEFNRVIEQRIK